MNRNTSKKKKQNDLEIMEAIFIFIYYINTGKSYENPI